MAYYYKIKDSEIHLPGIQTHQIIAAPSSNGPSTKFDFSKHVLIELLDDFTAEAELWKALDLTNNKYVVQKRLMIDPHRIHCRRAIVICTNAVEAKNLALRVSQTVIIKRCVCAVVVQELLSDLSLFEKQILNFGDERSQQQLLYVTDLNRCREPSSLTTYLKEKFSIFGTILSVFIAEDIDGYAYPEGVIKFAYLSEAFAAELAYDQLVVGMERLSVTTHHNILLTQCDLRVRLRETLQNSASVLESNLSHNGKSAILSKQSSENEHDLITYHEPLEKEIKPLDKVRNSYQTKNMTLKNIRSGSVLKKNVNLMCVCGNFNKSNTISDKTSVFPLSVQEKAVPSKFKEVLNTNYTKNIKHSKSLKKTIGTENTLSSKVSKRINIIPIVNFRQRNSLEHSVISNDNEAKIISNPQPTSCSFVTSTDDNTETTTHSMLSNKKKSSNLKKISAKNITVTNLESVSEDICILNNFQNSDRNRTDSFQNSTEFYDFNTMRYDKKNFSLLYDKLSLKNQRLHSQSQMFYPSNLFAKSDTKTKCKSPVVRLRRQTSEEIKNWINHTFPSTSSAQRSSRIISQKLYYSSEPLVQEVLLDFESGIQTESPLRMWLKYELHYSSNNRVTGGCLENSKKVVYPTTKQDILVSVGCSHMTCASCYPKSTNLLFGFR